MTGLKWLWHCLLDAVFDKSDRLSRPSFKPMSDEEAYRLDAAAIGSDWAAAGRDMETARRKVMRGRIVAVACDKYLHELEVELAYDVDRQQRRSRLRCGKEVHIPIGKMFLANPRTIDCPGCKAYRSALS